MLQFDYNDTSHDRISGFDCKVGTYSQNYLMHISEDYDLICGAGVA